MRKPLDSIFATFLRLGLTSFGGPVAHLGYFRAAFVERRAWLQEAEYADLIALAQFLPGPASSQVGAVIGLKRGGLSGAFAAWLGFTLPSALLLVAFALTLTSINLSHYQGALHGLKVVAVAIVAHAVWGMSQALCLSTATRLIAAAATIGTLSFPSSFGQIATIGSGALLGMLFCRSALKDLPDIGPSRIKRATGFALLGVFALLFLILPLLAAYAGPAFALFNRFYRTGALVFGGGHVVLPVLKAQVLPTGILSSDQFLAGYALAQALPGPLFAIAAYIGAAANTAPSGWSGAAICLVAIFLPGLLLIIGIQPFWQQLRPLRFMRAAMQGANASVVGILLAALYDPLCTTAIHQVSDAVVAIVLFALLWTKRLPTWSIVGLGALAGWLLQHLP